MSLHHSAIYGRSVAAATSEPATLRIRRLLAQPSTSSLILIASTSIRALDLRSSDGWLLLIVAFVTVGSLVATATSLCEVVPPVVAAVAAMVAAVCGLLPVLLLMTLTKRTVGTFKRDLVARVLARFVRGA